MPPARPHTAEPLVLAVDVGSTSAPAGVFDLQGHMLSSASHAFEVHRPQQELPRRDDEVELGVRDEQAGCLRHGEAQQDGTPGQQPPAEPRGVLRHFFRSTSTRFHVTTSRTTGTRSSHQDHQGL